MIIDSHQHVILPTEKQLHLMKEAGIEKTILFSTSIHPEKAEDLDAFEKEMRTLKDIISGKVSALETKISSTEEMTKIISENPDKFIGFGSIPTGLSEDKTLEWVEKQIVQNNLYGMGELTLAPGSVYLLEPIFKASAEFGKLPLWIHTFSPLTLEDIKQINELSKKFLDIPVILGHSGGINWLETIKLVQENKNLYMDTSAAFSSLVLSLIIKTFPERTLFSSDAPHGDPVVMRNMIERITSDKYVRQRVLGDNIAELLEI
ncbi:amidohydrolase family protein [Clostridium oryzae]|uniref:Amidohydrolase n=1 Tax=Clostridium oryzae TaxID=1450648 RepID=A0A1V4IDM4_9CLOT|nr:amidohydrolase family protein [Clostridium oryzae]OPJ58053.1 amidohydrolase [Clostridium oryzae]